MKTSYADTFIREYIYIYLYKSKKKRENVKYKDRKNTLNKFFLKKEEKEVIDLRRKTNRRQIQEKKTRLICR